jgi:hypothetical protein
VLIGLFNCLSAMRLRLIDIPPLARYPTRFSEEEMEQAKRTAFTKKEDLQFDVVVWADVLRDINKAFDSIEKVANEFNKATNLNRGVLYAAASFFLAAGISFWQGLSNM